MRLHFKRKNESNKIYSQLIISKQEKRYALPLLKFLQRIGFPEQNIPKLLIRMAAHQDDELVSFLIYFNC